MQENVYVEIQHLEDKKSASGGKGYTVVYVTYTHPSKPDCNEAAMLSVYGSLVTPDIRHQVSAESGLNAHVVISDLKNKKVKEKLRRSYSRGLPTNDWNIEPEELRSTLTRELTAIWGFSDKMDVIVSRLIREMALTVNPSFVSTTSQEKIESGTEFADIANWGVF